MRGALWILWARQLAATAETLLRTAKNAALPRLPCRGRSGRACVILGTGPSFERDLSKRPDFFLSGRAAIAVNEFPLSEHYGRIRPSHLVILDPAFWSPRPTAAMEKLRCSFYEALLSKTAWEMKLMLPAVSRSGLPREIVAGSKLIRPVFFNSSPGEGFPALTHAFYRSNLCMPPSHNVLVAAVFVALNEGFSPIYLSGVDHAWHKGLRVDGENRLFLDGDDGRGIPLARAILDEEPWRVHEYLQALSHAFREYHLLRAYAASMNAEIVNLTPGSFIDAFVKRDIADL